MVLVEKYVIINGPWNWKFVKISKISLKFLLCVRRQHPEFQSDVSTNYMYIVTAASKLWQQ